MGTRSFFADIALNQNELQFAVMHPLASAPSSGSEVEGQFYYDTGSQTPFFWDGSSWTSMSSAAASNVPFSGITSSTNTAAAMVVGNGASISFVGTGTIDSNILDGYTVDLSDGPNDGEVLTYIGGSIDAWVSMPSGVGTHVHAGEDITSGTINDDRLSSNVGLLDAPQLWTAANQFDDLSITGSGGRHTFTSARSAGGVLNLNDVDGDIPIISTVTDNNGDVLVRDGEGFEERPLVESDISDLGTYFDTAGSGLTSSTSTIDLDINSLTAATIASGDFVPFWDITATADNKKTTFANFQAQITTVGTITSGVWNGTDIAIADGGTGASTQQAAIDNLVGFTTRGDLLTEDASGNAVRLPLGTVSQFLVSDGSDPSWATISTTNIGEGANLYYTDERVDDRVDSLLTAGTNITLTYDDGAGTLTIDASGAIDGSGAANRIAFWSDSDTLSSDADFTFDGTDAKFTGGDIRLTTIDDSIVLGKDRAGDSNAPINIINDGNSQKFILFEHYYSGANTGNDLRFIRSRGSEASKTALQSSDEIGTISFHGYSTSSVSAEGAFISAVANENWGASAVGTTINFGVAPISTPAAAATRFALSYTSANFSLPVRTSNGLESAPAHSFITDTDTGIYLSALGVLSISAGGSQIASFNGNTSLSTITGDLTVTGDLLISGSTTTINTTNLIVEDNFIVVNSAGVTQDAGIEVERGSGGSSDNAYLRFSESVNEWYVDNGSVSLLMARKYVEEITGDDSTTVFNIDHNMGTLYVMAQVFDSSTGKQVEVEIDTVSTSRVALTFKPAPAGADSYRVVVVG